jgi:succinyl-diaminopimelate desuccinylase
VSTDPAIATRLAERTLELVNIASVSRDEAAIMRAVRGLIPDGLAVWFDDGEVLVAATPRRPGTPLILLAGHVDTVPPQDNFPGRVTDAEVVGLGASDMKGGIAVMLELARWIGAERPDRAVDVALVIFTREELPVRESPLPAAFAACPDLAEAALAIVLEPTDNTIQSGCVGNLNGTLRFHGRAGHSARPWSGDNAINRAVAGLAGLVASTPRVVEIEGLRFTEVVSVTRIHGGIADNVIPDLVECHVNFRFTPDRTPDEAVAAISDMIGDVGEFEITSVAPSGRVAPHTPLFARLVASGDFAVAPKQAWTPVAQFTQIGIDAVNLGPGATAMAHTRDERVSIAELVRTYSALLRFIAADDTVPSA